MKTEPLPTTQSHDGSCCGSSSDLALVTTSFDAVQRLLRSSQVFRIATMGFSVEESGIRQALENIPGIRLLGFQLGARTLKIDAVPKACPLAL